MEPGGRDTTMAQKTKRGAAVEFCRHVILAHVILADFHPHECISWPFARNGSGRAVFGKKRGLVQSPLVHRVVCSVVHGQPPSADHEAAHTCGNGHLGCINPRHLEWKTSKDNKADQLRHGTRNHGERNGMSKLTAEQVAEIRSLRGMTPQKVLADRFGIDQSAVSDIQLRKLWRHV